MREELGVIDLVVKVLINAIGVYVTVLVVPQIKFAAANDLTSLHGDWWKVVAVALILAIVNTYLRPILKVLSFPITLLSMGLFALVLNALLLLLVAFLSDQLHLGFKIGAFPPTLNADGFIGAVLGSIVISIVSVVLGLLNRGRRIVG
jgi:putative membrane protein